MDYTPDMTFFLDKRTMDEYGVESWFKRYYPRALLQYTILVAARKSRPTEVCLCLMRKRDCQDKALLFFDEREYYYTLSPRPSTDLARCKFHWRDQFKDRETVHWFKRDGEVLAVLPQFQDAGLSNDIRIEFEKKVVELLR